MNQWHQMKTMLELMAESIPQRVESRVRSCGPRREEEPRNHLSIRLDEVNLENVFRDKAFMGLVLVDEPSPALFEKKNSRQQQEEFPRLRPCTFPSEMLGSFFMTNRSPCLQRARQLPQFTKQERCVDVTDNRQCFEESRTRTGFN